MGVRQIVTSSLVGRLIAKLSKASLLTSLTNILNVADGVPTLDSSGELTGPLIVYADTDANLTALSKVPAAGERWRATDTDVDRIGDGAKTWASLPDVMKVPSRDAILRRRADAALLFVTGDCDVSVETSAIEYWQAYSENGDYVSFDSGLSQTLSATGGGTYWMIYTKSSDATDRITSITVDSGTTLKELRVNGLTSLATLSVTANTSLTSLDLTGCVGLTSVDVSSSGMGARAINTMFASLPYADAAMFAGSVSGVDNTIATAKGWSVI